MSRYYSDPSREHDTYALPDVEVFYADRGSLHGDPEQGSPNYVRADGEESDREEPNEAGWYYWFCLPGCLPDSDPFGPFDSEEDALAAAREDFE